VWNHRDKNIPAGAVYVGRPTLFGNPFKIGEDGDRAEVVAKYREWVLHSSHPNALYTRDVLKQGQLRGKDLVCWCAPLACHADVLMELANQ
jgi:hypothetical protein